MQNCIAHILYYIYSDRFFFLCTVQPWPNQLQIVKGARAHHLAIYSSVSRLPSAMSLRTVAHRNMSTTRLYRYRRKTNSSRGENFYWYIANDKISPIPTWHGQVWWPILGNCALHLTHPKCTHTHSEHTPRAVGSHLCCGARGAVGGSVPCSRAPQSWYWRWMERCTFTPPTYNSCQPETRTRNLWIASQTL